MFQGIRIYMCITRTSTGTIDTYIHDLFVINQQKGINQNPHVVKFLPSSSSTSSQRRLPRFPEPYPGAGPPSQGRRRWISRYRPCRQRTSLFLDITGKNASQVLLILLVLLALLLLLLLLLLPILLLYQYYYYYSYLLQLVLLLPLLLPTLLLLLLLLRLLILLTTTNPY